jgi:rubrerythrin
MSTKVEENLAHLFARDMRSAARNTAFMLKAEQEGDERLALLFKAFENERYGIEALYPGMVQEVKDSAPAVKKGFIQSMKTDQELLGLYETAMDDNPKEEGTVYYVCQICGHIHKNSIPKRCPVCRAVPGRFKRID